MGNVVLAQEYLDIYNLDFKLLKVNRITNSQTQIHEELQAAAASPQASE
jgi:hypothetical protein